MEAAKAAALQEVKRLTGMNEGLRKRIARDCPVPPPPLGPPAARHHASRPAASTDAQAELETSTWAAAMQERDGRKGMCACSTMRAVVLVLVALFLLINALHWLYPTEGKDMREAGAGTATALRATEDELPGLGFSCPLVADWPTESTPWEQSCLAHHADSHPPVVASGGVAAEEDHAATAQERWRDNKDVAAMLHVTVRLVVAAMRALLLLVRCASSGLRLSSPSRSRSCGTSLPLGCADGSIGNDLADEMQRIDSVYVLLMRPRRTNCRRLTRRDAVDQ